MRRSEVVNIMKELYNDIPDGASSYHKMDVLLYKLERLGLHPPETYMKGMPEVDGNKVVLEWDDENEEELYGESVVAEVNADIKALKGLCTASYIDDSIGTLTLEKLLTAKEKLSNITIT